MKGLFVTGTDTEIGKSYVSTAIVCNLVAEGYKVAGMKPIGTGGKRESNSGCILNDDAELLMSASNLGLQRDDISLYSYLPPTSPHIAASEDNDFIDLKRICATYCEIEQQSDYVIVEGVGGWSVPLNETETVEDLAVTLALPVLLVVGVKLGCINHALLTRDAILRSGVQVAGWVANIMEPDLYAKEKVVDTLQKHIEFSFWGEVPFYFGTTNYTLPSPVQNNLLTYASSVTKRQPSSFL